MAPPVRNTNTKLQWFPSGGLHILQTNAKLQNVISLAWLFQTWWPANESSVGKLTADFIAINKCGSDFRSRTLTQYEARAKRSHAQNKQCHNYPCHSPMFRVVAYRLPVLHLVNRASGVPICFICLNMWVNIMGLALNPGPQFAAITGNPAGLLFSRIWYSVGKSVVLGITEYRQGRPLICLTLLRYRWWGMLTGGGVA